jgi:signal transduction histidine kinase
MTPLRIVIAYAVFGIVWVLLSNKVLSRAVPDPVLRDELDVLHGAMFVVATCVVLFLLMRRQLSEQELLDEEVRTVIDGMADAVLVVDADRHIIDVNQAAARLFGAPDRHAMTGPFDAFAARIQGRTADGRPLQLADHPTSRALAGETVPACEVRIKRLDGQDMFVSISSAPVRAKGRTPRFAVSVVRDMSDVTRFEEAREEFIAAAAHEFRTPLAIVKAYAQLMAKRGQGDPAALDVIGRQIDRLTHLLEHLLEVSRFQLGGDELKRDPFDLGALLAEVTDALRDQADGRSIAVESTGAAVVGDRTRIGQVIARLVENALRFSPRGGQVEARLVRNGEEAKLSVRDHGPGIPPERQAHVFERSYRAHAILPEYAVFGGGLDVSREIVARHGGHMWFESELGQGSTFSFSLPLSPPPEEHA